MAFHAPGIRAPCNSRHRCARPFRPHQHQTRTVAQTAPFVAIRRNPVETWNASSPLREHAGRPSWAPCDRQHSPWCPCPGRPERPAPPVSPPPCQSLRSSLAACSRSRARAHSLQQIFEVDPLACPTCRGPMRIIAFITQASVIDQILAHLRTRAATAAHAAARSPPSTRGPSGPDATRRPAAAHQAR